MVAVVSGGHEIMQSRLSPPLTMIQPTFSSRLATGSPTVLKAWQQFYDNMGLFVYSFILSLALGPVFLYYPLATAYVRGRYPTIQEFKTLIWSGRYIKAAVLFYIAFLVGCCTFFLGVILAAAAPLYAHYLLTTDDSPLECLKHSISRGGKELIFFSLIYGMIATAVGLVGCGGLACFVTYPVACIHIYNVALSKKISTRLKRLVHASSLVAGGAFLGGFLVSLYNHAPVRSQGNSLVAEGFSRETWDFNSRAARRRLNCTENEHVDHIVALKEAFDSGAAAWPAVRKQQFANDSTNQWCLDATLNRNKSDYDLAEWNGGSCELRKRIATRTRSVKAEYGLAIDPAEGRAIREALNGSC